MAEERRTVGQQKIKISGTPAPKIGSREPAPAPAPEPTSKGRTPLLAILVLVIVVLLGAVVYMLRPWESDAAAAAASAEPEPTALGEVVAVEPISLNLADGRYLRLGFSIQFSKDAPKEVLTAKALDIAIATFSGRTVEEINDMESRAQITKQFVTDLNDAYEGSVVDIYYTDLVTQ